MKFLGAMLVVAGIAVPAQTNDVAIDNFKFAAPTIAVPVGTTVTWTNRDDVPHNVVSTDNVFKSPVLDTDQTFSHTFEMPGTFKYYCSLHPRMTGQIVVNR
jgi:3',5'-cyclic-AMP phosphodiesterase